MRFSFLICALIAFGTAASALAAPFGMIGKITAKPGQRDALIAVLSTGSGSMPENLSYVVAKDAKDPNVVWVTEAWASREAHEASLKLPAVREAIRKGIPLIADFATLAETEPVRR